MAEGKETVNGLMTIGNDSELKNLIEPWLAAEGLELDDLEFIGVGRARTLKVLIDGTDLDLDRIADVSGGLSRLLDSDSDIEGAYQLEVGSPGLERKLRLPRHFEKSIGREIKVKFRRDEATTTVSGVIEAVSDSGFDLSSEGRTEAVAFDEVVSAKTVFRWEKSPKPGKKENGK